MAGQKELMPPKLRTQYDAIYKEEDLDYALQDCDKLVRAFEDGSTRISEIVAGLRQYSRTDKDYYSPYDLHEAIESSLTLLGNRYKEDVTVHKHYGRIPKVVCSPGQINQVFMNLLRNAEQAIEEKGNVWITTYQENENVIVKIRDDGRGISSEHLSSVFNPFFTTKPVGSGTGLGLSISYGIIEQHGGTMTVESEVGEGATFIVSLPIDRKENT